MPYHLPANNKYKKNAPYYWPYRQNTVILQRETKPNIDLLHNGNPQQNNFVL